MDNRLMERYIWCDQPTNANPTFEKSITFSAKLDHEDSKFSGTVPKESQQSNDTIMDSTNIPALDRAHHTSATVIKDDKM